jgi:hypothetical protein
MLNLIGLVLFNLFFAGICVMLARSRMRNVWIAFFVGFFLTVFAVIFYLVLFFIGVPKNVRWKYCVCGEIFAGDQESCPSCGELRKHLPVRRKHVKALIGNNL